MLLPVVHDTAVGTPEDTAFLSANGEKDVVHAVPRISSAETAAYADVEQTSLVATYAQLLNSGNWLEIQAAVEVGGTVLGEGFSQVAQAILSISLMSVFHAMRIPILQASSLEDAQKMINQVKASIVAMNGVPAGIKMNNISWDALSYKVLPNAVEFLMYKFPAQQLRLSIEQCGMLAEIEDQCYGIIKTKCAEFRARTSTDEDEFVNDVTLFLEMQIAGMAEDDRPQRISALGRGEMIEYINKMQNIFLTGNLPGAIQPAKIYASHDAITQNELRGSIKKMAEAQIYQQAQLIRNQPLMGRAYFLSQGKDYAGRDWGPTAATSINIKKTVDQFTQNLNASLGVRDAAKPMAQLSNQLAGSANTLQQNIQFVQGDLVVQQTDGQKQISVQQLSVLLACLRIRANATQSSEWELLPAEDLDHIEIVKTLAHADVTVQAGGDIIFRLATVLGESYARGHNVTKFGGKSLPGQLYDLILHCIEYRVKALATQIKAISDNQGLVPVLIQSIMYSLAQRHRVLQEYQLRRNRRQVQVKGVQSRQL